MSTQQHEREGPLFFPPAPIQHFPLLATRGVGKNFRGLRALKEHRLVLEDKEILGIIGPNGSGKSTLFNVITGFSSPSSGSIQFCGQEIAGWNPDAVVRRGIARTFQGSRLFKALSVLENVEAAAQSRNRPDFFSTLTRGFGFSTRVALIRKQAMTMLDLVGLASWAHRRAGDLPYGAQRRLEIARAMATQPRLLMLDEPAAGLNTHETQELMTLIRHIRDIYAIGIIVVEHDMDLIGNLCERVQVLAQGEVICEGSFQDIQKDERVREAYFGHD